MTRLTQLKVVQLHQSRDCFVHGCQLNQGHFSIFGEKLEGLHVETDVGESLPEVVLFDCARYVGQMESRRWRVNIRVIFAARFLEPVQIGVGVVFGEASIRLAFFWQLHGRMLRRHHPNRFAPDFHFVQMIHGQNCLLGFRHLHQGRVFLVEQDLDSLDVAVDAEQDEQVIALRHGLLQVRHEQDAPRAPRPEAPVHAQVHAGDRTRGCRHVMWQPRRRRRPSEP